MAKVDDILNNIPAWGNYRIESYWNSGVTYPPTQENRDKIVRMLIAEEDTVVIYI